MTMRAKLIGPAIALAAIAAAAPASAQYYPYPQPQPRPGGVADQIARGAAEAAAAVRGVTDAVQGGYYGYGGQYGSRDSYAINACGAEASRYGRVSIGDVRPKSRDKMEVRGFVDAQGGYSDRGYGYNDRGYGYGRGYERRTFTCTVRYDGRITKFKTKRLRY
jgi:hypothetical protein